MKKLAKKIVEHVSTDIYDVLNELEEKPTSQTRDEIVADWVIDFLDYASLDVETIKKLKREESDFWNDTAPGGRHFCDLASEWADDEVSIYNHDLYSNLKLFANWTEEGLNELGYNQQNGLFGILQTGEYLFYSQFSGEVLGALTKIEV